MLCVVPALMCLVLLMSISSGQIAGASHKNKAKSDSTAIDIRIVAQQGLAIALASNVLQSQVTVLADSTNGGSGCTPMSAGTGSSKVLRRAVSGNVTGSAITIYYGPACTHPYIEAKARMVSTDTTDAITEDAVTSASHLSVHGTGTFTPHDGAPMVHLGLSCAIPEGSNVPPPFVCEGGIAQIFPKLGISLGSVTPITLTLKAAGSDQYVVHFASSHSTMERGATGALSIGTTANSLLRVSPGGTTFTSDATTGIAGRFALFPPTPTGWTITDRATKVIFAISVLNNSSRQLHGSVTTTSGKKLAQLSVDRSGTGSITYDGGATDPITNWLLSG
jgi:hypothetical protein